MDNLSATSQAIGIPDDHGMTEETTIRFVRIGVWAGMVLLFNRFVHPPVLVSVAQGGESPAKNLAPLTTVNYERLYCKKGCRHEFHEYMPQDTNLHEFSLWRHTSFRVNS